MWTQISSIAEGKCLFSTGLDSDHSLALYSHSDRSLELSASNSPASASLFAEYPSDSDWIHIAISVSDRRAELYVNGTAADGDAEALTAAIPSEKILTYLCADINRNNFATGKIADLRIYNRAITPEEVKALVADVAAIDSLESDTPAKVSEEYYSPSGVRLDSPAPKGVTIIRTIFSDGSSRTSRIIR